MGRGGPSARPLAYTLVKAVALKSRRWGAAAARGLPPTGVPRQTWRVETQRAEGRPSEAGAVTGGVAQEEVVAWVDPCGEG